MKRKILTFFVLALILPCLQGCFVLAGLGLLGSGTYYVGTKAGKREDERIKTQSLIDVKKELDEKQKSESAQDQTISTQISQNYMAGALTSSIAVYPEVRNSVVILHGRVPDAATAERAIDAARKTPGVQRIISNLVIMNQQPQQQQAAMAAAAAADPSKQQVYYQGQLQQIPPQYQQQYQQYMQQYNQTQGRGAPQQMAPQQQQLAPQQQGAPQPVYLQQPQQQAAPVQPVQSQQLQQIKQPAAPAQVQQLQKKQAAYPVAAPQEPQIQQPSQTRPQQGTPAPQTQQQWLPTTLKKEQVSNAKPGMKSQVAAKSQVKEQKTSPPGSAAQQAQTKPAPKPTSTSPVPVNDTTTQDSEDDNDSGYKEYTPPIKKSQPAQTNNSNANKAPAAPAQQAAPTPAPRAEPAQQAPKKEVIFVPVPANNFPVDNDELYRDKGSYNPAPIINVPQQRAPVVPVNQIQPSLEYTL